MAGRIRARARREREQTMIPCGGKGWRDGQCEFCRRKGADFCSLRNVPRDYTLESGLEALLRVGGGRKLRQAMRVRPKE